MSDYTPTTEDVREVAQTLSKCREFDPELCDECNRRVQDAERLLKSRWLAEHDHEVRDEYREQTGRDLHDMDWDAWIAEHDRQVKAEAWDEGWDRGLEDSSCPERTVFVVNPYREVSK